VRVKEVSLNVNEVSLNVTEVSLNVTEVSLNISGRPTALDRIFQESYFPAVNIFVLFAYLMHGVIFTHAHPLSANLTP
jgi:hypothetical protein